MPHLHLHLHGVLFCCLLLLCLCMACSDDFGKKELFEPNDSRYNAILVDADLKLPEQSGILGQEDEDWFYIPVPPGSQFYVWFDILEGEGLVAHIYQNRQLVSRLTEAAVSFTHLNELDGEAYYYVQLVGQTKQAWAVYLLDIQAVP